MRPEMAATVCEAGENPRPSGQQLNLSLLSIGKSTSDTKRLSHRFLTDVPHSVPSDPTVAHFPRTICEIRSRVSKKIEEREEGGREGERARERERERERGRLCKNNVPIAF